MWKFDYESFRALGARLVAKRLQDSLLCLHDGFFFIKLAKNIKKHEKTWKKTLNPNPNPKTLTLNPKPKTETLTLNPNPKLLILKE